MLNTRDVIAGKICVQMGLSNVDAVRDTLRTMDRETADPRDLINRLHDQRQLDPSAIEFLRHRVALYEHVRWEAVYVRLLERGTTVKKETVAKLLAELERSAFRRRLGDILVERGNLKPAYDQKIVGKQRRLVQQDDERILARYRKTDFGGVSKPLIPNSRLDPHEFKISTLFRSKETRALVSKAELELLRAEAAAAQGGGDSTMVLPDPLGPAAEEADMVETTKLPPGSVAQTKALMAMEAARKLETGRPASGSGEIDMLGAQPPSGTDEIPTVQFAPGSEEGAPLPGEAPQGSGVHDLGTRPPEESPQGGKPKRPKKGTIELRTLEDVEALERIHDYDIVEVLGVGGMGAVFLGQKEGVGEFVAIKVLLGALASDEERGRFTREIQLAERINHDNVLHVIESGETKQGLTFMVVPALAGKELRDLIDLSPGNGLAPPLVLTILRQMLLGLKAVHEAGVVHRDLKPENVFVLAGGLHDIKLMDFGLAKPADEGELHSPDMFRTQTTEVSGSPAYIAPESISCDPIDGRTDLYSLGVMLYEMLTGVLPLDSETSQGYLTQHLICPPKTLEEGCEDYEWPDELQDLLDRLLGKSRDERPESAASILAELDAGLAQKITTLQVKQEEMVIQRTQVLPGAPKGEKKEWGFKGLLGRLWGSK